MKTTNIVTCVAVVIFLTSIFAVPGVQAEDAEKPNVVHDKVDW